MSLNVQQKAERSEYLEKNLKITECSGNEKYVFISYASDNWETVFKNAVVPLQKEYGLRVYADKAFDKENDKWIIPMLRNIRGAEAVISFVSQSYIESYACFLELLTAVNNNIPIIFVALDNNLNLGKTTDQPSIESGAKNEILRQGDNLSTKTNNTSKDIMRAMKSAYTSLSTLIEQEVLSKYDISDAFINFFRDASVNKKTIADLKALSRTVSTVSNRVFDETMIEPLQTVQERPVETATQQPVRSVQERSVDAAPQQPVRSVQERSVDTAPQQPVRSVQERSVDAAAQQPVRSVQERPVETATQQPVRSVQERSVDAAPQRPVRSVQERSVDTAPQQPVQPLPSAPATANNSFPELMKKRKKLIIAAAAALAVIIVVIIIIAANSKTNVTDKSYSYIINGKRITVSYTGQWKNDKPEGHGKAVSDSGFVLEGEFKDGLLDGQGKETLEDGSVYEGEFKNGTPNGQGTETMKDGSVYEGGWTDGKKNGQGKHTKTDGSYYEGHWENGQPNGQGKATFSDGYAYEGEWKDGKQNGQGKLTTADGSVYEGEWKDGEFIG